MVSPLAGRRVGGSMPVYLSLRWLPTELIRKCRLLVARNPANGHRWL